MPLSRPQDWLIRSPVYGVNTAVLPRGGLEPILLRAASGKGLGQVPCLLQVSRDKGRRASFPRPCHHTTDERGHDLLSHSHALRASLAMPLRTGSALSCCPGEV